MKHELRKYKALFLMNWQEIFEYRASFWYFCFISVLPFFLMYFLWQTVFENSDQEIISGFTFPNIITYYFLATIIYSLSYSSVEWMMGWRIRDGKFSIFFSQPISPMAYCLTRSFAGKLIEMIIYIAFVVIIYVFFMESFSFPENPNIVVCSLFILLAAIVYFLISYFLGLLSFILEEAEGLYYAKDAIIWFFSGAMIPLEFFGENIKNILYFTPFGNMISFPIKVFSNSATTSEILTNFTIQLAWIAFLIILIRKFYNHVSVNYSAVGDS